MVMFVCMYNDNVDRCVFINKVFSICKVGLDVSVSYAKINGL